jgi:hypothetical protein
VIPGAERLALPFSTPLTISCRGAEGSIQRVVDSIRQLAEDVPCGGGIDSRAAVGLDHELGQGELAVRWIEQHAVSNSAAAQPI